jgi:hypothetical protein
MDYFPKVLANIIEDYTRYSIQFLKKNSDGRIYLFQDNHDFTLGVFNGLFEGKAFVFPRINRYCVTTIFENVRIGSLDGEFVYNTNFGEQLTHVKFTGSHHAYTPYERIDIFDNKKLTLAKDNDDKGLALLIADFDNPRNYCLEERYRSVNKYYVDGKYKGSFIDNRFESSVIMSGEYILINDSMIDMNTGIESLLSKGFSGICFYNDYTVIGFYKGCDKNKRRLYAIDLRTRRKKLIYKHSLSFTDLVKFNKSNFTITITMRCLSRNVGIVIYSLDNVEMVNVGSDVLDFWVM